MTSYIVNDIISYLHIVPSAIFVGVIFYIASNIIRRFRMWRNETDIPVCIWQMKDALLSILLVYFVV